MAPGEFFERLIERFDDALDEWRWTGVRPHSQTAPCRVGMEACGSSHYWAREIRALGHEVVLIPPAYTKPYVKRGKNDANDAAAICEAMSRPDMRFVPIKSADQQAVLMLHKTRELLVKQLTMAVNALRGHLSEFGLIAPKGIHRVKELLALAQGDETLPEEAKQATAMLASHSDGLDEKIDDLVLAARPGERQEPDEPVSGLDPRLRPADRIGDGRFQSRSQRLQVGKRFQRVSGHDSRASTRAAARTSSAPSPKRATDICARCWSSGCTSVLRVAHKYKGALAEWIVALRARKPERIVAVALANKLARIAWAMMSTGEAFRTGNFTRRPDDRELSRDRRFSFEGIGKRNDVMNDTVATKARTP